MTQRQKNIRGIILSGLLLTLVLGWYGWQYISEAGARADRKKFSLPDATHISKVELRSGLDTVDLHYDGTRWLVNQTWPADRQMVTVFFATLAQVETKRKIEAARADSVQAVIRQEGVNVRLVDTDGGTTELWVSSGTPTYIMNEQYPIPELVTLPGYRVDVSAIFGQTTNDWRDKRIFNFNWQNFKSLRATFPSPEDNFVIQSVNGAFSVEGMPTDTARMNEYLDAVSLLQADRILSPDRARDSVMQQTPARVNIVVEDLAGRQYPLEIWPNPEQPRLKIGRWQGDWVRFDDSRSNLLLTPRSALKARPQ